MAAPMSLSKLSGLSQCLRCVKLRTLSFPALRTSSSLADQFAEAQKNRQSKPAFRTSVPPAKQTRSQEGMFYTIPKEEYDQSLARAFSVDYTIQMKTFVECAVMVRRPALEVINYMKQAHYTHRPLKYVLYGNRGVGKTITAAHIMHYCATEGWMILHFPWPSNWNYHFREISPSSHVTSRIDLPVESVEWLRTFRKTNQHLITQHELTTMYRYDWSKRESLEAGASWNELIDHGIARPKYASDCVGAVLKEIRGQSASLPFKTLLMVDGVNSLWAPTRLKDENHKNTHQSGLNRVYSLRLDFDRSLNASMVPIERYSLVHNLKKMMMNNWTNGAILATVDMNVISLERRTSFYPKFLLGIEGYELFDPFIPVSVENYDVKELTSCLDYYTDRLWIQSEKGRSDDGRKEMAFLSEGNPYALYSMCSAW